ncbi:MAG: hypothetical protein Tsb002_12950 [Wenzhouxiangellaceae bacterium]
MLVISRRENESIYLELDASIPPGTPVEEIFNRGPITITVLKSGYGGTRLGIAAPETLRIIRGTANKKDKVG